MYIQLKCSRKGQIALWATWFSIILPPYGRGLDYIMFHAKLFYDSMKTQKREWRVREKVDYQWDKYLVKCRKGLVTKKYQGNSEFLLNHVEFITKGKKKIHACLAVLFLLEAEKIRPGVFRFASFTGPHLYLVSIYRATEKDTGFISVILGHGSRQWNSWDHSNNLLACSFLSPPVACCFLPVPEHRQHKGAQKQLLHYS